MINEKRLKACHALYGSQSINYHVGAINEALKEADEIAKALGVERIMLHNRLEQMAGLVWAINLREQER